MTTQWQYLEFRDGYLFDESGDHAFFKKDGSHPHFNTVEDAEEWLREYDIRATII